MRMLKNFGSLILLRKVCSDLFVIYSIWTFLEGKKRYNQKSQRSEGQLKKRNNHDCKTAIYK
jgi:hypothetical protein